MPLDIKAFFSVSWVFLILLNIALVADIYKANKTISKFSLIKFNIVYFLVAIFCYFVEVIGVNTGLFFGSYSYGKAFGFGFFSTPFVIGLNWVSVNFLVVQFVSNYLLPILSKWLLPALYIQKKQKSISNQDIKNQQMQAKLIPILPYLVVPSLMVLIDILLEIIAPKLDFWVFTGGMPGLQNYIDWWLVAFVITIFSYTYFSAIKSNIWKYLLYGQIIFFILMLFVYRKTINNF